MSERLFLFVLGAIILLGLYFEVDLMIYLISLWMLIEGITDFRLTTLSQKLIDKKIAAGLTAFQTQQRFDFEAMRALRVLIAIMLGGSFYLVNEHGIEVLWFVPWFMGFAIMGAGASGVCPMVLFIRWLGFR